MDAIDIAHWRMHSLRLSGDRLDRPEDVVHWLGAVQSQDYGPAKWSVGDRVRNIPEVGDAALDRLFADGAILRTHVLRPTWHFVSPADIRWLLELTGPRVHQLSAYYYRQLGLPLELREKCSALMADALKGGNWLTRKELAAVLAGVGITADAGRLGYIVMHAELDGVICSGPMRGKQHTYALVEERAPQARNLSPDEALTELTVRYFTSHGPATVKDFSWWSSLTLSSIKRGLQLAGSRLQHEIVDGLTYWFAEPPPPSRPASPTVHLLQGYDEYIVGYSESKYALAVAGGVRSVPTAPPIPNGVVILDSQVAGHWKRTLSKDTVVIEAALYQPLDEAQSQALQAVAARHGEFVGRSATVVQTAI
jgi:hypothetical protein